MENSASASIPPRVFLWCVPRSCSTVFTNFVSYVDGAEVWFEPYVVSWMNKFNWFDLIEKKEIGSAGKKIIEEVGASIPEEEWGNMRPLQTYSYQSTKAELEKEPRNGNTTFVFIKDMAFAIDGHYDYLPTKVPCKHVFLIRHPHRFLYSYRRHSKKIAGCSPEEEYKHGDSDMLIQGGRCKDQIFELWKYVRENVDPNPVVMDTDDMLEYPDIILPQLFARLCIPWKESYVSWEGTHWMQEIVQLILHDGQLHKLSAKHRRCIAEVADVKVPSAHLKAAAGPVLRELKNDPSPRVITTHCPYALLPQQLHEKHPKMIYVYRNPKDSLVSRYNFNVKVAAIELGRQVKPSSQLFSSFFDALTSGNYAYGCWFDHIKDYWGRKDDINCIYVSYEDMKTDLQTIVKKVAAFLCHPLEDDVIGRVVHNASLETMRLSFQKDQTRHPEQEREVFDRNLFINKGEVNQWQSIFTPKQNELFDKLFMEKMKNCELTKAYAASTSTRI